MTPSTTTTATASCPKTQILCLQPHSLWWWEGDAFLTFINLFVWPVGLVLVTSAGMLNALLHSLLCLLLEASPWPLLEPRDDPSAEDGAPLETGLYWYGLGNVYERETGEGCPKHFDPSRPSVIYVHGFQPHTVARQFRESLNWSANDEQYGLDVDAADHWIEGGWNVGVFYWREYADETYVQFAEAKMWTTQSPVHMRYRTLVPALSPSTGPASEAQEVQGPSSPGSEQPQRPRTSYAYVDASVPCVSEQLACALQRRFSMGSTPYRLVGHSLGAQLVIHSSTLLSQRARDDPAIRLPTRLALLDPFFTPEPKPWLGWRTISSVLYEEVRELSKHIVLEQYQTSIISNPASRLSSVTATFHINLPHIPWYRLRARHVAAPYLYFLSFADEWAQPIKHHTWNRALDTTARLVDLDLLPGEGAGSRGYGAQEMGALAKASDEAVRLLMHARSWEGLWGGILGVVLAH